MDIRALTPRYNVAPQIGVEDVSSLAEAGITLVICNRPDNEVPPSHQAATIGDAVRAAGLAFVELPLTHMTMTADNVAKQAELIDGAKGSVLAYCASGTRCSVIWALGRAGHTPVDEILATTARAGYALDGLRPQLETSARG